MKDQKWVGLWEGLQNAPEKLERRKYARLVTNPAEVALEKLRYLIAWVGWTDSEGDFINRARSGTWVACLLHVSNTLAKQHGAVFPVTRQFWYIALLVGVTFVGGNLTWA